MWSIMSGRRRWLAAGVAVLLLAAGVVLAVFLATGQPGSRAQRNGSGRARATAHRPGPATAGPSGS